MNIAAPHPLAFLAIATRRWLAPLSVALFLGVGGPFAQAQEEADPVLANATEDDLLAALTPPPRTRDLKIQAPRKASLLITFLTNSADLTPRAREQLDVVARALTRDELASYRFGIEGHADPRGNHGHNLALSRKRADSVARYLVRERGLSDARLVPEGKGDLQPLRPDVPAAPENRRVTFVNLETVKAHLSAPQAP